MTTTITPEELIRKCVSAEVYEAYRDNYLNHSKEREPYDRFGRAIQEFFRRLPETGLMQRSEYGDHYDSPTLTAWNAIADRLDPKSNFKAHWAPGILEEKFTETLLTEISMANILEKQLLTYEYMVTYFSRGEFNTQHPRPEHCEESGLRLDVPIRNWKPEPQSWTAKGGLAPLPEIQSDEVRHALVTFPSGNVMVADMIRIEELVNFVNENEAERHHSSSTRSICQTTDNLAKLGVVFTYVGNSSPKFFTKNGAVVVGHDGDYEASEHDRGEFEGTDKSVCTDLWWVTMVDQVRLLEILSQGRTTAEASVLLNQYMEENANEFDIIDITPGEYHFYFHGEPDRIRSNFEAQDINFGAIEYQFLLSKEPVTFKLKISTPKQRM